MQQNDTRNTFVFVVIAVILLTAYQFLVLDPANKKRMAEQQARAVAEQTAKAPDAVAARASTPIRPTLLPPYTNAWPRCPSSRPSSAAAST